MARYVTRAQLEERVRNLGTQQNRSVLVEKAAARSVSGSVFLSHASADATLLPGVVSVLEEHGGAVYIDKRDAALPSETSGETARLLHARIAACKTLVLFATQKSIDSRWVPWELGVADGLKTGKRVALFPTVETAMTAEWAEREYLGLYDRVVYDTLGPSRTPEWFVWDRQTNTGTRLRDWLKAV